MISQAIAILKQAGLDLTAREIADILWLSTYITPSEEKKLVYSTQPHKPSKSLPPIPSATGAGKSSFTSPLPHVTTPPKRPTQSTSTPSTGQKTSGGIHFKVPAPNALRNALAIGKALRPLKRKVLSYTEVMIDEVATATRLAQSNIRFPVFKPAPQRWLEVAVVIEQSSTTIIWKQVLVEFQRLLKHQGAFRDVRVWGLKEINGQIQLVAQMPLGDWQTTTHSPKELIDATAQRLILLVSDCISPLWRKGLIHSVLELWGKQGLLTILQVLPSRLWERTALVSQVSGQLRNLSFDRHLKNSKLRLALDIDDEEDEILLDKSELVQVPIITLEPRSLSSWAKVLIGTGEKEVVGYVLRKLEKPASVSVSTAHPRESLSASKLVNRFRGTASPVARRLAGFMAFTPVNISVVHLIQKTLLPQSNQLHVAEVFMSGLLKSMPTSVKFDLIEYEFVDGVREILRQFIAPSEAIMLIEQVSDYIARRYGLSPRSFVGLLLDGDEILDPQTLNGILPFARLTADVLRGWGGDFTTLADNLEDQARKQQWLQEFDLQSLPVKVPTIVFEGIPGGQERQSLLTFDFKTIFVNRLGEIIETKQCQADYYQEFLELQISEQSTTETTQTVEPITMIYIPEGELIMGSDENEEGRWNAESPQHLVNIAPFYMSQTPITQAQWRAIASLPQVKRELNPNPSYFEGDDNPVENIDWGDAIEWCARLSKYTARQYRLPSEAEWEYACRGFQSPPVPLSDREDTEGENAINTKVYPPFHFGDTITDKLANYDADETYADEPKGEYRGNTTPVKSFKPNAFGLYDMHGNVWEWCLDPWHDDYKGAPNDGNVWDEKNQQEGLSQDIVKNIKQLLTDERNHVVRGGSYDSFPRYCRSAYRNHYYERDNPYSFRVVFVPPQ
ncbi:MAG: SAV_2336 N-terminal domain-related protein [Crocosphaera sp.]